MAVLNFEKPVQNVDSTWRVKSAYLEHELLSGLRNSNKLEKTCSDVDSQNVM